VCINWWHVSATCGHLQGGNTIINYKEVGIKTHLKDISDFGDVLTMFKVIMSNFLAHRKIKNLIIVLWFYGCFAYRVYVLNHNLVGREVHWWTNTRRFQPLLDLIYCCSSIFLLCTWLHLQIINSAAYIAVHLPGAYYIGDYCISLKGQFLVIKHCIFSPPCECVSLFVQGDDLICAPYHKPSIK
jgi:hypothetical protein